MIVKNKVTEINDNKKDNSLYGVSTNLHHEEYIAALPKGEAKRASFQRAMKLTILIGQCFGLNPVIGVCEIDTSKMRFTVYSGRFFYTLFSLTGQMGLGLVCVLMLGKDNSGSAIDTNRSIVFYATNTLTTIFFIRIAMKWPKLCETIARVEAQDPNMDSSLVKRCNVSCLVVLSLASVEHILSDLSGIALAIDCQPERNLYEAFILQSYPWLWSFINYNHVFGFLSQFFNFQCTFNWNFADAFVICISWYLTARLKQVNDRILAVRGKYVTTSFWRTMREDYCKACSLVRRVDNVISYIVFISFANNLFFICFQFLHLLEGGVKASAACDKSLEARPLGGFEQSAYFLYSFGFLLSRSLAVSLIASTVHTASKIPAQSLYDVPSSSYCVEVQRFIDQIHGDTVALSGLQFFNVKRGLVLTIAGTVVTYELVLMQFAGVTPTSAPPTVLSYILPLNSTAV